MHRTLFIVSLLFLYFNMTACSGSSGAATSKDHGNGLSDIQSYSPSSPYAEVITQCARAETADESCTLDALPFIAQETENPDIDKIMSRVVVSHQWMGHRFSQALGRMPSQMLPMFSAITAIVIDADIRPSYYDSITGAIYLDPRYLWLNNSEKQTINKKADYRSGFSDPLAFRIFSRYVKDGEYAYDYWSLEGNATRSLNDIKLPLARVLLHELAHANDFLPPGSSINLETTLSVARALNDLPVPLLSSELTDIDPLTSGLMRSLAGVMYRGNTPSEQDLSTTASEAGNAFGYDVASDDYAYTSQFEDLAMLFENTMMAYFFGAEHEVGFARPRFDDAYYCDEYTIDWGAINRIGAPLVKERARFVTSEILVDLDLSTFYTDLPAPETSDEDWCIYTSAGISSISQANVGTAPIRPDETKRPYH